MSAIVIDLNGQLYGREELLEIARLIRLRNQIRGSWSLCSTGNRLHSVAQTLMMLDYEVPTLFCQLKADDAVTKSSLKFLQENFKESHGVCAFLTSGSMGFPKLVVHNIESLREAARKIIHRFPQIEGRRLHHLFPENYMAGILNSTTVPIIANGSILLDDKFDFRSAFLLSERAYKNKSQYAWLSPSMLTALTSQAIRGKFDFPSWDLILSATGPLSTSARDQSYSVSGIPIINTFGTTESMFISTELDLGKEVSCGVPLEGVQTFIQLNDGTRIEYGHGPLCVQSDTNTKNIFKGYQDERGNIEFSNENLGTLSNLLTGDECSISETGIKIIGRTDDLVVLGGLNVSLSKIEEVARNYREVLDACAVAPFGGSISDLVLFFETYSENSFSVSKFNAYLIEQLGLESTPRRLVNRLLPKTANGKVDKQKLLGEIS